LCTYTDAERFFSFRRQGAASGRMAALVWLAG
jgi:copper oxidase (laccase) domain-containing protein